MIEVNNVTKYYGSKKVLDNISFSVNKGEILGFLGPNGAGKYTTMNIITGYISSSEGEVLIDSYDILKYPLKAKAKIGYLPEIPPLYLDMTVKDYLSFMFDLKKVKEPKQEHINEICELVRIDDVYNRIIKHLSKGYRQRVGLAQALLGYPAVIILDEPTVGLDPKQIIEIRDLIKGLKDRHTVILSSHILSEIQAVCDRVLVINKGKIVANDTPESLSKNMGENNKFIAKIKGDRQAIYNALIELEEVIGVDKLGRSEDDVFEFEITTSNDTDARPVIFREMSKENMQILELKSSKMDLEDIFLTLTEQDDYEAQEDVGEPQEISGEIEEEIWQEIKEEEKEEPKQEVKEETKEEPKQEVKEETKEEPKQEVKEEAKKEPKQEVKKEAKKEPKQEVKEEVKEEPKPKVKKEVKKESKQEVKDEAKEEPKQEVKEETKRVNKRGTKRRSKATTEANKQKTVKEKTNESDN